MAGYAANVGGIGVGKRYGPTEADQHVDGGSQNSQGDGEYEAVVYITSEDFLVQTTGTLPDGAIIRQAYAVVTEAFTFTGGTSPTMDVGTDTSEATNGAGLDLTATGTEAGTLAGTWASPLAADITVGVATSGTPTSVDTGKAKVVIKYDLLT